MLIKKGVAAMGGFILITTLFALGMALVSYLLHLIKVPWIKYIPASLFLIASIVMFIMAQAGVGTEGGGWGDLILAVMSILIAITSVVGFVTCIILDILHKKRRQNSNV